METLRMNRRQWLRQTGGVLAAASYVGAAQAPLVVRAFEADGKPAEVDHLKTFLLNDPAGQPYHLLPDARNDGTASIAIPKGKFDMMMTLPVRDFGQVYLYADNDGALYPPSTAGDLLLNYEFARSRAAFVQRYVKAAQAEGVVFTSGVTDRLSRGEAALARAAQAGEVETRAGHSNDSLAETMWAGETAAVERARHHIARNGPRPGFLFGCNAFGYAKSDDYARLYRELLNFGTVPFYRAHTEKVEGKPDYSWADEILDKLDGAQILRKGHPLVWFHYAGIPEFLKTKSWSQIKES